MHVILLNDIDGIVACDGDVDLELFLEIGFDLDELLTHREDCGVAFVVARDIFKLFYIRALIQILYGRRLLAVQQYLG